MVLFFLTHITHTSISDLENYFHLSCHQRINGDMPLTEFQRLQVTVGSIYQILHC